MNRSKLVLLVLVLLALIGGAVHAASSGNISFTGKGNDGADFCEEAGLGFNYSFTANTDDGGGKDWVAIVFVDANGVALDVDFADYPLGAVSDSGVTDFGSLGNDITARPVTAGLFDITNPGSLDPNSMTAYNFALTGTLLAQASFDPGIVAEGACEDLTVQSPFVLTSHPAVKISLCLTLPDGSVVGNLASPTQADYAPGKAAPGVIINPGTYWVIGEDESGAFYKVVLSCQYLWVPVAAMQPSFQPPWSGQALPSQVVS